MDEEAQQVHVGTVVQRSTRLEIVLRGRARAARRVETFLAEAATGVAEAATTVAVVAMVSVGTTADTVEAAAAVRLAASVAVAAAVPSVFLVVVLALALLVDPRARARARAARDVARAASPTRARAARRVCALLKKRLETMGSGWTTLPTSKVGTKMRIRRSGRQQLSRFRQLHVPAERTREQEPLARTIFGFGRNMAG